MKIFSRIVGTGRALPGQPVTNEQLAARLAASGVETSDAWIRERTGIAQRYIAPDDIASSDLAAQAARAALEMAGLAPNARPDPGEIPNNHWSYAIQWFLFALVALVIYGIALRKRLAVKGAEG